MNSFNKFCVTEAYIPAGSNIFTMKPLNPQTDLWIIGWLMKKCAPQTIVAFSYSDYNSVAAMIPTCGIPLTRVNLPLGLMP